ncbi:hypothetical protein ACFLXL_02445 [Chloroflexota bacterium]
MSISITLASRGPPGRPPVILAYAFSLAEVLGPGVERRGEPNRRGELGLAYVIL